jgi:putative flippase GtrA
MSDAQLITLRLGKNARQLSKFAAVGVLNTAIDFALFTLLYFLFGIPIVIANTVAYCTGVVNSFVWNKYWTFAEQKQSSRTLHQFPLFFGLYLVGLGLSNLTVWALALSMPALLAKGFAIGVSFLWNFWSTRRFVYTASAIRKPAQ